MDFKIPLPKLLDLSTCRWGGTKASFTITRGNAISLAIDVNKVDQRPYKRHTFICKSESYADFPGNSIVVDWDANAFPSAIKCGENILGYVDGTIFDANRSSLGYVKKTDMMGNRWEIVSAYGKMRMNRKKRREHFSWKERRYQYDFVADEMNSTSIDIRLMIGLVVEFWTPRLLMYADSGPTG